MGKSLALLPFIGAVALGLSGPAAFAAIQDGDCYNCHTAVIENGTDWQLANADCISCHAQGEDEKIVTTAGGDFIPQVFHRDPSGDLAAGNFIYIADAPGGGPTGSRKGHDVVDLFPAALGHPPGFIHPPAEKRFERLTCAGKNGCHGIRNQMMTDANGSEVPRTGLDAVAGSHHGNEDGPLTAADTSANSFRFLLGVRGFEHLEASFRWENASPRVHNEYYGSPYERADFNRCPTCHVGTEEASLSSHIRVPGNSMSGFCATCHSDFHMHVRGAAAFIRHPADYALPRKGEYARYTRYALTAPVARDTVYRAPSDAVRPGKDLIMCLSCHVAHASPYDGMLRFDMSRMTAGAAGDAAGTGCFACHTSKG